MKKNDILTGVCVDYTHEGEGIVKSEGFPFFIKNVIKGETVRFLVLKMKSSYGYGKCLEILESSKHRRQPFCSYYGRCGGCQIQHMSYDEQLSFKHGLVQNNIAKIGKLKTSVLPVIGCDKTKNYRNKAQFPITMEEEVKMGFYRIHSNDIIAMDECRIQSGLINEIMQKVKALLIKYQPESIFRHLLVKHAIKTDEVMVVFIVRKRKIVGFNRIVNELIASFPQIKSIVLNVNKRKDNVILGDEEHVLFGDNAITDELDGLKFTIASRSFYQVNPLQTEVLYKKVLDFAQIGKEDTVIDLYCGVGTISLFLARSAKKVIGIEIVAAAIANAKKNALLNNIKNAEFVCSDAASYASKMVAQGMKADVVVVDPPRKGCDSITLESIVKMAPERIVYVSCNPATLARDLKQLESLGYLTKTIQPVDMFPNSFHVETVVLLSREKVDGHIEIDLDVEKLEGKSGTATYAEIKKYVADHNDGMKVSSLYIGQIKNKMGLEKRKNYNVGSGEGRVTTCPQDKEEAIVEAFKHFNLIDM